MWNYYVATREHWEKHLAGFRESHCTDHEGGAIVLIAKFRTTADQDAFEAEAGVTRFPRLYGNEQIGATLAVRLNSFENLKALGIVESDSTHDVGMKLRKFHSIFDPRRE